MLQAVPPLGETQDYTAAARHTFSSVAAKAERAAELTSMPRSHGEHRTTAVLEARDLIRELLPLAELPTYAGALRVLHEVRRELGVNSRDVDLVALRRNLALYLDGEPERG
jgi:hypothetical protein